MTSKASIFEWVGWPTREKATSIPFALPDPLDDVDFPFFFFSSFNFLPNDDVDVLLRIRMTYKSCACYIVTDTR